MSERPIVVIAGPTASGKTAAGVHLARACGGELVGADSVQVFRGFDIGSSKPTTGELGGIPQHLVDVVDPDAPLDAMDYARLADAAIEEIHGRGRLPIVVGGTGLWIRALVRGLVDVPPVDAALRARLEAEAAAVGSHAMHSQLERVDPISAGAIHPHDTMRVVRALEVHAQTGRPLGEMRREHALGEDRYPTLFIVLEAAAEVLDPRIDARLEAMVDAGWVEEVRSLRERWPADARAFGSVGYREIVAHLEANVPWEQTARDIRTATRRYARRQRTWFGNEPGVSWRTGADAIPTDEAVARVLAFMDAPR